MKYLITTFLVFISSLLYGQKISGIVVLENEQPLSNASVVIRNAHNHVIYALSMSDKFGAFTLPLPKISRDSLQIRCTYLGYAETLINLQDVGDTGIKIILLPQPKDLPGVTLDAPPIWRKGDTTFFNVDKLKKGSELKLQELLVQLPGFELDENKILKYENKPVQKILTDGDDLFSEKVNLMISNFPLHLVENIQVLENQSINPLLKGIEGGQDVVINLQLKKSKIKLGAGDAAAGLDTEGRYSFNAVVFSLLKKTKAAYIGNFSKQGNGVDFAMEREMRDRNVHNIDQWLINTPSLRQFSMFENNYYINNKLRDHRFTITGGKSKTKFKTELNLVNDQQFQQTVDKSSILSNNEFIRREATTDYQRSPAYFHGREEIKISLNKTAAVNIDINYFDNRTGSVVRENIHQESFYDTIKRSVDNNSKSVLLYADFTRRKTNANALIADFAFAWNNSKQTGLFRSAEIASIFQLTNNEYNHLNFDSDNSRLQISAGTRWLRRNKKNQRYSFGLRLNHELYNIHTLSYVNANNISLPKFQIYDIGGNGKFKFTSALANYQTSWRKSKTIFSIESKLGVNIFDKTGDLKTNTDVFPAYYVSLKLDRKKSNSVSKYWIWLDIKNESPELAKYSAFHLPQQANYIKSFRGDFEMIDVISFDITKPFKVFKQGLSISLHNSTKLNSIASIYDLNKTMYFVADTIVAKPNILTGININMSERRIGKQRYRLYLFFTNVSNYSIINRELVKNNMYLIIGQLKISKEWQKKYFLDFSSKMGLNKSKLKGFPSSKFIGNYENNLKGEWKINTKISTWIKGRYHIMGQYVGKSEHYFLADAGVQYKIKRIALLLDLNNLTNIRSFNDAYISPTYQSQFYMPIIPRNIALKINYSF